MKNRLHQEEILKQWINEITKSPGALSAFNRLEERGGTCLTFETARVKDIELMITLCIAAYNHGCTSTREHIQRLKDYDKAAS